MSQVLGESESRERNRDKFPLVFKNDSDETVPPFAIMRVTLITGLALDGSQLFHCNKPNSTGVTHIFNGPFEVRKGKKGRGRMTMPLVARYKGSAGGGVSLGPVNDSWAVQDKGLGYTSCGNEAFTETDPNANGLVLLNIDSKGGNYTALIYESIGAGSASNPIAGKAYIYRINSDGTATEIDEDGRDNDRLYNPYNWDACGSCACSPLSGGSFLISGPPIKSTTAVTSVSCDSYETAMFAAKDDCGEAPEEGG